MVSNADMFANVGYRTTKLYQRLKLAALFEQLLVQEQARETTAALSAALGWLERYLSRNLRFQSRLGPIKHSVAQGSTRTVPVEHSAASGQARATLFEHSGAPGQARATRATTATVLRRPTRRCETAAPRPTPLPTLASLASKG